MRNLGKAVAEIFDECSEATEKFGSFASAHEGYAVLLEEVEELKKEVFWGKKSCTDQEWRDKMRAEAVQVGAMAARFIIDVCDEKE